MHQQNTHTTYIQKEELGSGTYATVFLGINTNTNVYVALKKIKLTANEGMPATALREISALKKLKHPNIISLLDIIQNPNFLTIVFEYVEYDLKEFSKKFGFSKILIKQLSNGLSFVHKNQIIHRDLKPQNILVTQYGILKIADFGLCKSIKFRNNLSNEVVTLWYRAPELLENKKYSYEIDIFSIGCIVYEMVTGEILLYGNDNYTQLKIIYKVIGNKNYFKNLLQNKICNEFFEQIIYNCSRIDRDNRWTVDELIEYSFRE